MSWVSTNITIGDFRPLGGSRRTLQISILWVFLSMRTFPIAMDLPGEPAAT